MPYTPALGAGDARQKRLNYGETPPNSSESPAHCGTIGCRAMHRGSYWQSLVVAVGPKNLYGKSNSTKTPRGRLEIPKNADKNDSQPARNCQKGRRHNCNDPTRELKFLSIGKLRDELLNRELFLSLEEACWVIDRWRLDYNHYRIHTALNYQTPAAYAAGCVLPASATPQPPEHSRVT